MARVLFVEPFYGGSHRAFLDGLVEHSQHQIEPLTLPEGEWRRRMRRGATELASGAAALEGDFDALIASDMLDLSVFLALTRPRYSSVPTMAYFHENQFTYPRIRGTKFNSWFGQINYLSALTADTVAFNSEFHRHDFLGALRVLAGQPNNWLQADLIAEIERKSTVAPNGVELDGLDGHRRPRSPNSVPLILWNHRWEFDKGPADFADAMRELASEGHAFKLAVAGEPGANPDPVLDSLVGELSGRVTHAGFLPSREEYAELLWQSDIVVSTTRHEFFGVGMVEALYCGCFPIAPRRFNYPELVPLAWHERTLYSSRTDLLAKLRDVLSNPPVVDGSGRESASRFDWSRVAPLWDAAIEQLAAKRR